MKIIQYHENGKSTEKNIQWIMVKKSDKYGVAMLAYFKNTLKGQNVEKLTIKNPQSVQLFYNRISNMYILQILRFHIGEKSILQNYDTFHKKYDTLIKDKISHLQKKGVSKNG